MLHYDLGQACVLIRDRYDLSGSLSGNRLVAEYSVLEASFLGGFERTLSVRTERVGDSIDVVLGVHVGVGLGHEPVGEGVDGVVQDLVGKRIVVFKSLRIGLSGKIGLRKRHILAEIPGESSI